MGNQMFFTSVVWQRNSSPWEELKEKGGGKGRMERETGRNSRVEGGKGMRERREARRCMERDIGQCIQVLSTYSDI